VRHWRPPPLIVVIKYSKSLSERAPRQGVTPNDLPKGQKCFEMGSMKLGVIAETESGALTEATLECVEEAREVADAFKGDVHVWLPGHGAAGLADELAAHGADVVTVVVALSSDPHTYEKPGKYRVLIKVVDIFGNDTSQAYDVEVS